MRSSFKRNGFIALASMLSLQCMQGIIYPLQPLHWGQMNLFKYPSMV